MIKLSLSERIDEAHMLMRYHLSRCDNCAAGKLCSIGYKQEARYNRLIAKLAKQCGGM